MSPPMFTATPGNVFYRGTWIPRISAENLLAIYEGQAADLTDWNHTEAGRLARELRGAMDEAYQMEIAA